MYKTILLLIFLTAMAGHGRAQSNSTVTVEHCNLKGHLKCIRITAKEVYADGAEGKWSDHWKRMSYIGEACVREHGEKKGKRLETIFALPHYFTMFFVNVSGLVKYTFSSKGRNRFRVV